MITIDWTGEQRLQVELYLNNVRAPRPQLRILDKILNKIELSEEERVLIRMETTPDGTQIRWNVKRLEDNPQLGKPVVLEDQEATLLLSFLNQYNGNRNDEVRWLGPLCAKIERLMEKGE